MWRFGEFAVWRLDPDKTKLVRFGAEGTQQEVNINLTSCSKRKMTKLSCRRLTEDWPPYSHCNGLAQLKMTKMAIFSPTRDVNKYFPVFLRLRLFCFSSFVTQVAKDANAQNWFVYSKTNPGVCSIKCLCFVIIYVSKVLQAHHSPNCK